jgi:DNA-binding beta-propeller fold protein YncE
VLLCAWVLVGAGAPASAPGFVAFESGPVRPMAMSPDGSKLFVANTPNGTLEVFNITPTGLVPSARVPVGLEPVAVAVRSNTEAWVVNMLSDSVSVVTLVGTPRVVHTLHVGDEPRDIVFAGSPARAFITTAHRGQQRSDPSLQGVPGAGDPQLTTPGVGRADVWVFDANDAATDKPLRIVSFFADTPRALAVSPDGGTVYVAAFKSGNQTTLVNEPLVCDGFKPREPCVVNGITLPGGNPGPATNAQGKPAPETSLIVKYDNPAQRWQDELHRDWNPVVPYRLPDLDVFALDAQTLQQTAAYPHVGTVLFNMVANPVSGALYVSNTEALNQARFEGPGQFAGQTLQGRMVQTRVTVIEGGKVLPRHLNKHIDYDKLAHNPAFDAGARSQSLSMPLEMVVTRDGKTLYVAAHGSSRVGVFDTAELEADTFNPRTASARYISVSGGGPSGLVLDEARGRLYVATRFDNAVKVIDLATNTEVATQALPNPEPASVVEGRPMLYDAQRLSANGESSCASCHVFGDADELAWDLGNPDDKVTRNPIPINLSAQISPFAGLPFLVNGSGNVDEFHPMKGPMTTQTLRGLRHSGAMHWRGDRATGAFGSHATDSELSFKNFVVAFDGLMGRAEVPTEAEMQKFANFQLQLQLPPNPVRRLDNTLTESQQRGRNFYMGPRPSTGVVLPASVPSPEPMAFTCEGCHRLDPSQGFFGAGGRASFDGSPQPMKIPQLRNAYTKVGLFRPLSVSVDTQAASANQQVRGFGYLHDGGQGTLFQFFNAAVFAPQADVGFPIDNPDVTRRDVEQFVLAYDSDLAPVVGQQVTLTSSNAPAANPRIDLLIQRAQTPFTSKAFGGIVTECELVVRVAESRTLRAYLYDPVAREFVSGSTRRTDATLRTLAANAGQELTYTCVPPGSGARMAFTP